MVSLGRAYLSRARLSRQRNTQRDLVSEGAGRVSASAHSVRQAGRHRDGRVAHRGAPVPDTGYLRSGESALTLAVFTLLATFIAHDFWNLSGTDRLNQSRVAMAHLAIIGGLLLLAAAGPGRFVAVS